MTLFYMLIDAQTHTLHWASAGHDACQVFDPANGTFTALEGPDIPLGIEAEWKYAEAASRPLKPGEIAVLGTDGVWETRNEQGSFFGKDRLRRIVEAHHERSAVEICDEIFLELAAFRGNEPQRDDVTIIVVKVGTSEASAGNGHQGTLEFPDKVHAETSTVQ